MQGLRGRKE